MVEAKGGVLLDTRDLVVFHACCVWVKYIDPVSLRVMIERDYTDLVHQP